MRDEDAALLVWRPPVWAQSAGLTVMREALESAMALPVAFREAPALQTAIHRHLLQQADVRPVVGVIATSNTCGQKTSGGMWARWKICAIKRIQS